MAPTCDLAPPSSVSVSPPSIWIRLPAAISVIVLPLTVTLSSVSVTLFSTDTLPPFRVALPSIVLEPVTSISPLWCS